MRRLHALAIAVLLGVVAVAGTFAALDTTSLGMAAEEASASDAEIEARRAKLDKAERALRRAAKRRPPELPALPARRAVAPVASAPAPAPASGGEAVVVRREDDLEHGFEDDDFDDDFDDSYDDDTHSGDTRDDSTGGGEDD